MGRVKQNIYLKNGTLFAIGYNRIVQGEREDYVEFEKEHIVQKLYSELASFWRMNCSGLQVCLENKSYYKRYWDRHLRSPLNGCMKDFSGK